MSEENPYADREPIDMDSAIALVDSQFPDAVKSVMVASWLVAKEEFIVGGMDVEVERFINRAGELGTAKIREMLGQ